MLNDGLILMCTGMGTVFTFLVILWVAVLCMGKIIEHLNKIFPEEVKKVAMPVKSAGNDIEIAIAIAAAKLRK